jgi:hypothetical protein
MPDSVDRLKKSVEKRAQMNTLSLHERMQILDQVKAQVIDDVEDNKFVYIGPGAERKYDISNGRLRLIYTLLREEEGYSTHLLQLPHPDPEIDSLVTVKILTKDDVSYQEVWANRDKMLKLWLDAQNSQI